MENRGGMYVKQMRELEELNQDLLRKLDEKDKELVKLKNEQMESVNSAENGSAPPTTNITNARIIELAKKHRAAVVQLEKEKTKSSRLAAELMEAKKQLQASSEELQRASDLLTQLKKSGVQVSAVTSNVAQEQTKQPMEPDFKEKLAAV